LEEEQPINAAVGPFLLPAIGLRIDERTSPPLELVLVPLGKVARAFVILGGAMYLKRDCRESIA